MLRTDSTRLLNTCADIHFDHSTSLTITSPVTGCTSMLVCRLEGGGMGAVRPVRPIPSTSLTRRRELGTALHVLAGAGAGAWPGPGAG